MKAFLSFGWQPEWDVQSIKDVGWLCDRRTIFHGAQKILPGHYLTCLSFNTIAQHKYWDVEYKDKVCNMDFTYELREDPHHDSTRLRRGPRMR